MQSGITSNSFKSIGTDPWSASQLVLLRIADILGAVTALLCCSNVQCPQRIVKARNRFMNNTAWYRIGTGTPLAYGRINRWELCVSILNGDWQLYGATFHLKTIIKPDYLLTEIISFGRSERVKEICSDFWSTFDYKTSNLFPFIYI